MYDQLLSTIYSSIDKKINNENPFADQCLIRKLVLWELEKFGEWIVEKYWKEKESNNDY